MRPTLRLARPSEYTAIGELTLQSYAEVLIEGGDDPYRTELLDAAQRGEKAELWVAVDDDDVLLGTVTVGRPGTPYAEIAKPDEVEVRMLGVSPDHGRRGIGRLLMEHVHNLAAAEEFANVVLSVISTNTAAASFYLALGYQRCPERDWRPYGTDEIVLEVFSRPA